MTTTRLTTEQAEKHVRNAWQIGVFSLVMAVVFGAIGTFDPSTNLPSFLDPIFICRLVVIAILVWGTYRRQKFAALLLFIFYIGLQAYSLFVSPSKSFLNILIIAFFSYYLVRGVQGAFFLAKQKHP